MVEIAVSNLFSCSLMKSSGISNAKASGSFTSILRDSIRKSNLSAKTQPRIGSLEETGSLSETELEDKFCSRCGSRIKEDGTCPICIVPVFISGNPGAHNSGSSQARTLQAVSGNRVTASYYHRKR